jgi:uncharacterized membrane protein
MLSQIKSDQITNHRLNTRRNIMQNTKTIVNSAVAGILALSVLGLSQQGAAAEKRPQGEKCAGIVKAGKNDCGTAVSSCAGSAKADNEPEAWIFVPKGTCGKIAGSHLQTSEYAKHGGKSGK